MLPQLALHSDLLICIYELNSPFFFDKTLPNYEGRNALLHLDGDLYESYKVSLENLYDKVVPGGVIMFDKYRDKRSPGATLASDEFFADKPERIDPHVMCRLKYFVTKM